MKKLLRLSFIFILVFSFSSDIDAQKKRRKKRVKEEQVKPVDEQIEVTLKNGNVLLGELIRYDKDSLVIMNEQFGRVAFAAEEVDKYSGGLDKSGDSEGAQYDMEKYHNKYFLSPTARPAGKGNYYYSNYYIFANSFAMGLSDNFTLTAGFESLTLFAGQVPLIYVSPKFSLPISEQAYIGLGTTAFISTFDDEFNAGGIVYANTTIGSALKNFTVGLGFGFANDEFADSPSLLMLGFAVPLSRKLSLVGESFSSFSFEGAFNLGLRIVTKGNYIFDVGFTRPLGLGADLPGIGIPLLSFSVPIK